MREHPYATGVALGKGKKTKKKNDTKNLFIKQKFTDFKIKVKVTKGETVGGRAKLGG